MSFDFLFGPLEELDRMLGRLFEGAPLVVALGIAVALGLRHACDPDHLVAVTSLVAAEGGDTRRAARLGAWWGLGHAGVLLVIGVPLIALGAELPPWLEGGAEKAVGVVIVLLAARVGLKWLRGGYRAGAHAHSGGEGHAARVRHLRRGEADHPHQHLRTPSQAFGIGALHGLAGSGAVAVLLIAALPSTIEAVAALALFAPMSLLSMTVCTAAFAWVLTRPVIEPLFRGVVIPCLGAFGLMFGLWYTGVA